MIGSIGSTGFVEVTHHCKKANQCILLGNDPITGKNVDHRKRWIDDRRLHMTYRFGVNFLALPLCSITCIPLWSIHFSDLVRCFWFQACPQRRRTIKEQQQSTKLTTVTMPVNRCACPVLAVVLNVSSSVCEGCYKNSSLLRHPPKTLAR